MTRLYAGLIALLTLVMLVPMSALADTWVEPINTPDRFMVLSSFNDEAVLDRETGLVWEQSPIAQGRLWSASLPSPLSVEGAQTHCKRRTLGNRKGWRLPTIQELASLVDPTVPPDAGATLPAGHPFTLFPYVYGRRRLTTASPTARGS